MSVFTYSLRLARCVDERLRPNERRNCPTLGRQTPWRLLVLDFGAKHPFTAVLP